MLPAALAVASQEDKQFREVSASVSSVWKMFMLLRSEGHLVLLMHYYNFKKSLCLIDLAIFLAASGSFRAYIRMESGEKSDFAMNYETFTFYLAKY